MIGGNSRRPSVTRTVPDIGVFPIFCNCPDALGLFPLHLYGRSSNESFHQTSDLTLYLATLFLRAYVLNDVLETEFLAVL